MKVVQRGNFWYSYGHMKNMIRTAAIICIIGATALLFFRFNGSQESGGTVPQKEIPSLAAENQPGTDSGNNGTAGVGSSAGIASLKRCVIGKTEDGQEKVAFVETDEDCPVPGQPERGSDELGSPPSDNSAVNSQDPDTSDEPEGNAGGTGDGSSANIPVNQTDEVSLATPASGSTVSSPFTLSGKAKVTKVYFLITNAAGVPLIAENASVHFGGSADSWGTFQYKIGYSFSSTKNGFIEVFTADPNEQGEPDIRIPLSFE